jgi:UDP-glucose 4-epimerase
MKFLVVGGAGYIGSHMVKHLLRADHDVVVADNFSTGHRSALMGAKLVEMDIADGQGLDALFAHSSRLANPLPSLPSITKTTWPRH